VAVKRSKRLPRQKAAVLGFDFWGPRSSWLLRGLIAAMLTSANTALWQSTCSSILARQLNRQELASRGNPIAVVSSTVDTREIWRVRQCKSWKGFGNFHLKELLYYRQEIAEALPHVGLSEMKLC
jgi:hypothetical protein